MRIVPFRIIHKNIQPMRIYRKSFETEYFDLMALICIKPDYYNDGAARNTAKHKHWNGPCGPTWSRPYISEMEVFFSSPLAIILSFFTILQLATYTRRFLFTWLLPHPRKSPVCSGKMETIMTSSCRT